MEIIPDTSNLDQIVEDAAKDALHKDPRETPLNTPPISLPHNRQSAQEPDDFEAYDTFDVFQQSWSDTTDNNLPLTRILNNVNSLENNINIISNDITDISIQIDEERKCTAARYTHINEQIEKEHKRAAERYIAVKRTLASQQESIQQIISILSSIQKSLEPPPTNSQVKTDDESPSVL
jgi:hypothetical protein